MFVQSEKFVEEHGGRVGEIRHGRNVNKLHLAIFHYETFNLDLRSGRNWRRVCEAAREVVVVTKDVQPRKSTPVIFMREDAPIRLCLCHRIAFIQASGKKTLRRTRTLKSIRLGHKNYGDWKRVSAVVFLRLVNNFSCL